MKLLQQRKYNNKIYSKKTEEIRSNNNLDYEEYHVKKSLFTLACAILYSQTTFAVEGGVGRPITGMQVQPLNGLLTIEEGGVLTLSSIYYNADFGRSRQVPIVGVISAGLDYDISYNFLNSIFV